MSSRTPRPPALTQFYDRAETLLVRSIVGGFASLSPAAASNAGGRLLRTLGPLLPSHKVVTRNLNRALPNLSPKDRRRIGQEAWENLGRVLAEFVHLPRILQLTPSGPGLELVRPNIIEDTIAANRPAIFFSAHLSNWEITIAQGIRMGGRMAGIYRAPQRPGVDNILTNLRHIAAGRAFPLFPKGGKGGRDAFAFMRDGGNLCVLMDQKLNEGMAVPFFGTPAMTAPAAAKFALHFRCPLVPVHIERLGPARYRMIAEEPVPLPATGNAQQDTMELMARINLIIESWIRKRPGEWLWMHRRWPDEEKKPGK